MWFGPLEPPPDVCERIRLGGRASGDDAATPRSRDLSWIASEPDHAESDLSLCTQRYFTITSWKLRIFTWKNTLRKKSHTHKHYLEVMSIDFSERDTLLLVKLESRGSDDLEQGRMQRFACCCLAESSLRARNKLRQNHGARTKGAASFLLFTALRLKKQKRRFVDASN